MIHNIFIFALTLTMALTLSSDPPSTATLKPDPKSKCSSFSNKDFNEEQAIGTWHIMHPGKQNFTDDNCLEITKVTDETKKKAEAIVGKTDVNWSKVMLKMQIPCNAAKGVRAQEYYLELVNSVGLYTSVQVPNAKDENGKPVVLRHSIWLKKVENYYLGMMDCRENVVFLLSPPSESSPKDLEKALKELKISFEN